MKLPSDLVEPLNPALVAKRRRALLEGLRLEIELTKRLQEYAQTRRDKIEAHFQEAEDDLATISNELDELECAFESLDKTIPDDSTPVV